MLDGSEITEAELAIVEKSEAWKYLKNQIACTVITDSKTGHITDVIVQDAKKAKQHFANLVADEKEQQFPNYAKNYDTDVGNANVDKLIQMLINDPKISKQLLKCGTDGNMIAEIKLVLDENSMPMISSELKGNHDHWKRKNLRVQSQNQDILDSIKNKYKKN